MLRLRTSDDSERGGESRHLWSITFGRSIRPDARPCRSAPERHRVAPMREADPVESMPPARVTKYTGIYNADGGLVGEARYVIGHLFGAVECALCDITHSPVRRKPEWNRMVARLGVPIEVVHRNELDEKLGAAARQVELPVIFAHRADGSIEVALTAAELAGPGGSVNRLERALTGSTP